jgi:PAS domain S-box-containing protein
LEREPEEGRTPGTFVCYKHDPQDADSLSDNTVWSILEDRDGALWMGTSAGLNRLDPQTGEFIHYTTADGLPHDSVFGILEDEDGHLWLSTGRGLSRFDPQEVTFQNYRASDGLQGDVFNQFAYYEASTGELFFGGANGLTRFYTDDIRENAYIPPVHITGIQLANQPVAVGGDSPLQTSALETEELDLSYEDRIISFEFAALSFSSAERNRYKYKLEGFDEDWHETDSTRRFATYTNLDPGEYTFRVLGSNNSGVWNEEGDSLKLTITPPWWLTWWSRAGALLLLAGMVAVGFVWQWQSGKRRERQLEAAVVERTQELDERVKELDCLYGISRLAGQQGISLEQILVGVVDLLPPAMRYPEIACARIVLDGREFKTDNFRETAWQQSSTIVVRGEQAGQVEVGLLEETPDADEGPFLEEERLLLSAVAERLGRITERKQAEEALRESELRLELAVAGSEGGLWSIDLDPDDPSLTLPDEIYLSPRLKGLLGYEDEEFPNSMATWESHVHPEDLPRLRENSQRFLLGQIPRYEVEYRVRHKDGSTRWLRTTGRVEQDEDDRPSRFAGIDWDITERYEAEEALRESEEQHRDLVEKISDVIYAVDAGGVLTYLNPAAESLIGLPVEQLVGKPFARFIHPEDSGRAQNNHQALLSGEVPGPAEYRVLIASGETRWMRVTSQPIVDGGRVTGLQGVLTDITERKAVEAQLEEEATAAERQRLARELHDSVTQSLHSASLIAETVQLKWEEDPEEGRRGLEHLQRFTRGALAEMRTLLLELNPEALEAQELPVLLRQLAQATMARTRTSVTVTLAGECTVPADVKVALYRIGQEALNNVVKHAGARRVRINLQCPEARPGELDGAQTILGIKDDGCGFDPEGAQSSGLGIGIMRERARDIGATLSITSQPDLGTEVLVEWQAGQA